MLRTELLLVILVEKLLFTEVRPQGRMLDPPSRMSAWRLGVSVPVNYNDPMMNCGSIQNQWGRNGGKCGICGESWSDVKLYERPNGLLVQHSIITKTYAENDVISVVIQLTNNLKGWVEFRICDVATSGGIEATQGCLNRTLLADSGGYKRFLIPLGDRGFFNYSLVIPKGNIWGCDSAGCGIGHGDVQEEYYACADVAIAHRKVTNIMSAFTFTTKPSSIVKTSTSRHPT